MTDPKIALIQKYLEAAQRQDFAAMQAMFTHDLVYRVPGHGPLSGETRGQRASLDYFGHVMELTAGSYAISGIVDWLASTDRVALVAHETARRNGRQLDWTRIVLFTFREGLICEVALLDDKLGELDALLGG